MDREEFKFQMYLQVMRLRSQADMLTLASEEDERILYDGFAGKYWDRWLEPLAEQAGF